MQVRNEPFIQKNNGKHDFEHCLTDGLISVQLPVEQEAEMTTTIFTIGYEGSEVDRFLATLVTANVSHVIDIRDVPASRKRGFSKSALALALGNQGIGYTHLKALGDPKPGTRSDASGRFCRVSQNL